MTSRRKLLRLALSLVLLFAQQMALVHAMSHYAGRSGQPTQGQSQVSKGLAADQACEQCLAFAQIGSALGTPNFAFYTPDAATAQDAPAVADGVFRPCPCAFRSRAPPVA